MDEVAAYIRGEAESLFNALTEKKLLGRTITVKLRTGEFKTATRRMTLEAPPQSAEELARVGVELLGKFAFGDAARYRLAGLGVSNFLDEDEEDEEEPTLFRDAATEI